MAGSVFCSALAWLLTPYPSPAISADDSPIRGPFDVALCVVVVASVAMLLALSIRRRKGHAGDRWVERARNLYVLATGLSFSRLSGYEAADSAGFIYNGFRYHEAPGSTPGWAWWALAAACGALALFYAGVLLREEFRPRGRRTPNAATAASRRA